MIPPELIVIESEHWIVNHRTGSTYPGYLMIVSRLQVSEVSELSLEALQEMGKVLSDVELAIKAVYKPYKVLMSKLGFSKGFNCHFHVVPVHEWVLNEIEAHPNYSYKPDGNDVMLFVNREYCENQCINKSIQVALKEVSSIVQCIS